MHSPTPFHSPRPGRTLAAAWVALVATAVLAACSGGDRSAADARIAARGAAGCASLDTAAVVKTAVAQYIATTNPKPLRFLYMAGTDSMLPESGTRALQDAGPTYLWPPDAKQQPIVRKRLSDAGPWNALLVTYKGVTQPAPDRAEVRIGGTWIGPERDGEIVGVKRAAFECRGAGDSAHTWRLTTIAPEQGA